MPKNRIYTVSSIEDKPARLVRATSQAQAVSHVARSIYTARVATQGDLEVLLPAGVPVEDARTEQASDDEPELPEAPQRAEPERPEGWVFPKQTD